MYERVKALNCSVFSQKLHLTCLTRFGIRFCLYLFDQQAKRYPYDLVKIKQRNGANISSFDVHVKKKGNANLFKTYTF